MRANRFANIPALEINAYNVKPVPVFDRLWDNGRLRVIKGKGERPRKTSTKIKYLQSKNKVLI